MLYRIMNDGNGPEIIINENADFTDVVYVRNYGLNNQIFEFTIRRTLTNGKIFDTWQHSFTNLCRCSENSINDALALLLARNNASALKAYVEEYDYDGADTEDPEPKSEFMEFCEEVYNYIRNNE